MEGGLEKQTTEITEPDACLRRPWPRSVSKGVACPHALRLPSSADGRHCPRSSLLMRNREGRKRSICRRPRGQYAAEPESGASALPVTQPRDHTTLALRQVTSSCPETTFFPGSLKRPSVGLSLLTCNAGGLSSPTVSDFPMDSR